MIPTAKLRNALIQVFSDDTITGTGTALDPLSVVSVSGAEPVPAPDPIHYTVDYGLATAAGVPVGASPHHLDVRADSFDLNFPQSTAQGRTFFIELPEDDAQGDGGRLLDHVFNLALGSQLDETNRWTQVTDTHRWYFEGTFPVGTGYHARFTTREQTP